MPSTDFLVVDPRLTTVEFAQRLTAQQLAKVQQEEVNPYPANSAFTVVPYTQTAQRKLKQLHSTYYTKQ